MVRLSMCEWPKVAANPSTNQARLSLTSLILLTLLPLSQTSLDLNTIPARKDFHAWRLCANSDHLNPGLRANDLTSEQWLHLTLLRE